MFAILGSGFGLYCYLPSLIYGCNEKVMLPERYREKLMGRNDVKRCAEKVEWRIDEVSMLDEAEGVIIAKRPADQPTLARECLRRSNIKKILLEKPLAPTPSEAAILLDELEASGKTFRIGYNFRFTDWGKLLLKTRPLEIDIDWQFRAYHYFHDLQNWKRVSSEGGGALRFFGIHLVAFLAELGYNEVSESRVWQKEPGDIYRWEATLTQKFGQVATVKVNSDSDGPTFSIEGVKSLSDPFDINAPTAIDRIDYRSGVTGEICRDLITGVPPFYPWYRDSIDLWRKIEQQTIHD